jgi:DNA ligase-4
MVVFFDILALDEKPILCLSHYERMHQLENVVCRIPGYADFAERHIISFSNEMAAKELRKAFARCIVTRGEGLVVKPADESYFNFSSHGGYRSCCIKMKKEYIGTFGDVGDFAVVGASYDAVQAKSFGIPNLKWTEFYIGCLENKDAVQRQQATPKFVVIITVSLNREMMKHLFAHSSGNLFEEPPFEFRIEKGVARGKRPSVIFHKPFVFDIRCFAFEKEGNTGFWTMRFPQVSKIHFDRSYLDTITFCELQQMAESARADPNIESPQEELDWIKKLEATDSRGVAVDASTQQSIESMSADTNTIISWHSSSEVINEEAFASNGEAIIKTTTKLELWPGCPSKPGNTSNSSKKRGTSLQSIEQSIERSIEQSIKGGLPKKQKLSIADQMSNSDKVSRKKTPRRRSIPGSAALSEITQKINANMVLPEQASTEGKPKTVDPKEAYQPVGQTAYSRLTPSTGNVYRTSSAPQICSGSVKENAFPALSLQQSPVSKFMIQKGLCKWAGTSCAFARCSFTFSPCVASMPLLDDYLISHGVVLDLDASKRANALTASGEASNGAKPRKIMLAEMKRPRQTAEALRGMQDFGVRLRPGIGDWIEVYDWRLLEYITAIEQGKPATYDPWRHYWIGAT